MVRVTMAGIERVLAQIARWGCRSPRLVIGIILGLSVGAVILASRLEIRTDVASLAPRKLAETFQAENARWGQRRFLFLLFSIPVGLKTETFDPFIDEVQKGVRALEVTRGGALQDILLPRAAARDYFLDHALLLADRPALEAVAVALEPDEMVRRLARAKVQSRGFLKLSPSGFRAGHDPLELAPLIADHLPLFGLVDVAPDSHYFLTHGGRMAFLAFSLDTPVDDFAATAELRSLLPAIEQTAWRTFLAENPRHAILPPLAVQATGPHLLYQEERDNALRDFWVISLASLVGIAVLFWLFFRAWRPLFFASSATLTGLLWMLAIANLTVRHLNLATLSVAAVTLGLGIDFSIHLLTRYRQERAAGLDHSQALERAWQKTGCGVVWGALTSAAIFCLLMVSRLEGFRQLGFLLGSGVLATCLATLVLLPSLLTLSQRAEDEDPWRADRPLPLLGTTVRIVTRHPSLPTLVCLVIVLAAGFSLTRLQFRFSPTIVHSDRSEAWQVLQDFERKLDFSPLTLPLVVKAPTLEKALQVEEELQQVLKRLLREGAISAYTALSQWLPSRRHQEENLEYLKTAPSLAVDHFRTHYFQILNAVGFKSDHLQTVYPDMIDRALAKREPTTLQSLESGPLATLIETHLRTAPPEVSLQTLVYLPPWQEREDTHRRFLTRFHKEPLYRQGKVLPLAIGELLFTLEGLIRKDVPRIVLLGFAGIFLICWLGLSRFPLAVLATVPLLFGGVAMLSTAVLVGQPLELLTLLWLPTLIGLGVDDGIHLLMRHREGGLSIVQTTERVGRAIALTSLTTVVSFLSFSLTSFPMLRSAGVLMAVGMAWILAASLLLLPSLIRILRFSS